VPWQVRTGSFILRSSCCRAASQFFAMARRGGEAVKALVNRREPHIAGSVCALAPLSRVLARRSGTTTRSSRAASGRPERELATVVGDAHLADPRPAQQLLRDIPPNRTPGVVAPCGPPARGAELPIGNDVVGRPPEHCDVSRDLTAGAHLDAVAPARVGQFPGR
jgi:hypothetical protein